MSQESAKKFIKHLEKDTELAKRVQKVKNKEEMQSILKGSGYNFSDSEFKEAWKGLKGHELSENELMKITGGGNRHKLLQAE